MAAEEPAEQPATVPSRPRTPALLLVSTTLFIVGLSVLGALNAMRHRSAPPADYGPLTAWTLTDASGRAVSRDSLLGTTYLVDFFFTSCAGPCARMSAQMAKLQHELPHRSDLMFLSISIDPARDTPERLRPYAESYGADPDRWLFLTGPEATIDRLSREGFKLALDREANPLDIAHASRFVLIDHAGRIRGFYGADDPDALAKLKRDVEVLLP